jgi:hypothetical protein
MDKSSSVEWYSASFLPPPVEIFGNLWKSSGPRPVKPLFRDHRFITILIRGKYESENKDFHSFRVRIADLLY